MSARALYIAAIALCVVFAFRLHAATDEQLAAIEQIGRLNGVALQCKYFQEAQRIKRTLVAVLPKQRPLGQVFEDATKQSFLALLKDDPGCPSEEVMAEQVNAGIEVLNAAFPD